MLTFKVYLIDINVGMFKYTTKIDIVSWWICWWAVLSSWQIEIASFCCKTSKLVCKTCKIYTVKAWSTHEAWLWKNSYSVLIQDVIQGLHRNNVLFILVLLEAVVLKLRVNHLWLLTPRYQHCSCFSSVSHSTSFG